MKEDDFYELKIKQKIYYKGEEVEILLLDTSEGTHIKIAFYANGRHEFTDIMQDLSLEPPKKEYELLYECMGDCGDLGVYTNEGKYPIFSSKCFSDGIHKEYLTRKTGRVFKLNLDTWKVEVM